MEPEDIAKKYGIELEKLEKEQERLAKELNIKDKIDLSLIEKYGAVDTIFIKNKILCCFIVCDKDYEIIDRSYVFERVKFPYIPGFRSYREAPSIIEAFEKLTEKPDVILVSGQGIIHPKLGLASHLGLSLSIPIIGVSNSLIGCQIDGEEIDGANIIKDSKKVGNVFITKKGSNPMYISPGDKITVKSAYEVVKKTIVPPHKKPEPMYLAAKYSKKVREELNVGMSQV